MEQLSAEESAAMQAMQADTAPVAEAEAPAAPVAPQEAPAEAQSEAVEATEAIKPPPGMVPQQALHQERERRKEIERQAQETQRQLAEMQARIEALTAPKEQPIVVPDPVLQPEAFKQWQIDQIKSHAQKLAEVEQRSQEAAHEMQVMQRLNHDVAQFKASTPDYDTAFQHAVKGRQDELAFYGYSQEQINAQIEVDVRALVQQAYNSGKNPAELFYTYAKMRGYSPQAAQPAPVPQAAAQVQAFAEAQRQTQSLAPAGGPSNDGGVTLESVAKMSEAELAAMPKAKRDEMMRKVMGG